jgi:hypothetical protein
VVAPRGMRDLHAAFLRLALGLKDTPKKDSLWLNAPSVSGGRIRFEWSRFRDVLTDSIGERLKLVALAGDDLVSDPDLDERDRVAARAYLVSRARPSAPAVDLERSAPTRKFFEVWKVLVNAWFQKERPLALGELARRAGTSSPTLANALERIRRRNELATTRNRPVALETFPRRTLSEILALSESLRRPRHYVDASGRPPDPVALLKILSSRAPKGVAVGGVTAARFYNRKFDLNGLPRLDVVAQIGVGDDWLRDLNPALKLVSSSGPSPVLVVHPVSDVSPTAGPAEYRGVAIASPVETLLDLFELRLADQAEEMIRLGGATAK